MSGAVWAVFSGIGFGFFQAINRRAVSNMDVFVSTFMQLFVSAIILVAGSMVTQDISDLVDAPVSALANFILAGLLHFAIGWTFLNASQKRIGAARTAILLGTTPLFGALLAFITLDERVTLLTLLGILLITVGVAFTNNPLASRTNKLFGAQEPIGVRSMLIGMGAPVCWALSPIFIRLGLNDLDSPLLGVSVGITASALFYGAILLARHLRSPFATVSNEAFTLKLIAGILVGVATWGRWVAIDLTEVATVLALSLVSVPVVNLLTPMIIDKQLERVTLMIWIGSFFIIGGSLVLIFT